MYEGVLRTILGSKVVKKRYTRVTLGSCWRLLAYGGAFRSPWAHFGHMEVPLGQLWPLWDHFGITLKSFCGHLRMTLGVGRLWDTSRPLWGRSELSLDSPLAYEDDFGMVMVLSWVYKG